MRDFVRELARRDRWLFAAGLLNIVAFAVILAVAPFDTRTISGLNPWIKPVNWSTRGGDLRAAYVLAMHALQVLPVLGYLLSRRQLSLGCRSQLATMAAVSVAYASGRVADVLPSARRRPFLA